MDAPPEENPPQQSLRKKPIDQNVDKLLPKIRSRKSKVELGNNGVPKKRVRKPRDPNSAVENKTDDAAKPKRKWVKKSAAKKFAELSFEFDKCFNGPHSGENIENLFQTVNNIMRLILRQQYKIMGLIKANSKNQNPNVCVKEFIPVNDTNEDPSTSSLSAKRHAADTFYITHGKTKKLHGELLDYVKNMCGQK